MEAPKRSRQVAQVVFGHEGVRTGVMSGLSQPLERRQQNDGTSGGCLAHLADDAQAAPSTRREIEHEHIGVGVSDLADDPAARAVQRCYAEPTALQRRHNGRKRRRVVIKGRYSARARCHHWEICLISGPQGKVSFVLVRTY